MIALLLYCSKQGKMKGIKFKLSGGLPFVEFLWRQALLKFSCQHKNKSPLLLERIAREQWCWLAAWSFQAVARFATTANKGVSFIRVEANVPSLPETAALFNTTADWKRVTWLWQEQVSQDLERAGQQRVAFLWPKL